VWFVTVLPGVLNPDAGDSNRTKEDVGRGGRLKVDEEGFPNLESEMHMGNMYISDISKKLRARYTCPCLVNRSVCAATPIVGRVI
jgi:hypothetical protein